jgi:hypothetical protein
MPLRVAAAAVVEAARFGTANGNLRLIKGLG